MEQMIAEGRCTTTRCGWIFVLWGLVDIVGMAWQILQPRSDWIWPITIGSGFVLQFIGIAMRRRRGQWCSTTLKSRSISAVWSMMGVALTLFCFTAILRHDAWQISFIAAIFMIVGLAHAISATILRWGVQGFVAAVWWIGGIACFFVPSSGDVRFVFIAEMLFGMVFFGLYAMWLERRPPTTPVQHHA
jgi:hypothetical protein